jgi:ABC-type transporter Mla subunit MlaD
MVAETEACRKQVSNLIDQADKAVSEQHPASHKFQRVADDVDKAMTQLEAAVEARG